MAAVLWGVGGQANSVVYSESPATHSELTWGTPEVLQVPNLSQSIAGAVVNTVVQGFVQCPFPWQWVYDVQASFTGTGAGTTSVDIWNTFAAGTSANRIPALSGPLILTPSITTTPTLISARFANTPVYNKISDPYLTAQDPTYKLNSYYQPVTTAGGQVYPLGSLLTVRVVVPAATTLVGLQVNIIIVPSDTQLFPAT